MSIYCEFDGINGNVTAKGYENQIAISSFNFSTSRSVTMIPGTTANREVTPPHFSEALLTKGFDVSTIGLFKEVVGASTGKNVKLHFLRTSSEGLQEYMTYELSDCIVSSVKVYADGGYASDPREEIKLSYSKLMMSYTHFDKSNSAGNPERHGYDLNTAKML
ncbi:hypothetical protein MNBD_GAMMA23-1064 [hydrothermal vent metagenome]|uniref:Cytoplasmic protein USSDB7A n=1 Tax=hydrothermal vent metagenome TaxID=652676 RepID=A0A3B0ZTJ2_9ZZZZ